MERCLTSRAYGLQIAGRGLLGRWFLLLRTGIGDSLCKLFYRRWLLPGPRREGPSCNRAGACTGNRCQGTQPTNVCGFAALSQIAPLVSRVGTIWIPTTPSRKPRQLVGASPSPGRGIEEPDVLSMGGLDLQDSTSMHRAQSMIAVSPLCLVLSSSSSS